MLVLKSPSPTCASQLPRILDLGFLVSGVFNMPAVAHGGLG